MGSITVIPKDGTYQKNSPKKIRKGTLVWQSAPLHNIRLDAEESFWDDWMKHHFDLSLIRIFYNHAPNLTCHEEIKIYDGKSVIIGKRISQDQAVLLKGYKLKYVYSQKWVEKRGDMYTPQYEVYISIDHKSHFIKRYQQRGFDLGLVAQFIGKVAQAQLGQKVKMIGDEDIIIGTRTTAHAAMLISGMVRGEMDWDEYVDKKMVV
ncbi:MAG TPA: hypothetical protein EYP82_03305 [Hydrogenothermaceae bacterium]|nr:hypothetical protein [Hydrogenothermaceae bacterium]